MVRSKMLRTKTAELGVLNLLEDGGLVCSVTLEVTLGEEPPLSLPRTALLYWAAADQSNLAIGDLVAHSEHGAARYRGRQSIDQGDGEKKFMLLEFARGARLYVSDSQTDQVQKIGNAGGATTRLSTLGTKGGKWSQSYCVEALPNAYAWPGVGTFPDLPQELTPEVVTRPQFHRNDYVAHAAYRKKCKEAIENAVQASTKARVEWRRACANYLKALHANVSYRQAAQKYFEQQSHEPQRLLDWWVYRATVLRLEDSCNHDEDVLLIKRYVLRRERSIAKIRREVEALENFGGTGTSAREPIPENVRLFVWQRDNGQCVRCGSRERLEFDHIIPVVAGGSNTERNIQLLCESCNRSKGATV